MLEQILGSLVEILGANPILLFIISIISAVISGDIAIIILIVLAVSFGLSIKTIIIGGIIGFLMGDIIWYFWGTNFIRWIGKKEKLEKHYRSVAFYVDKIFDKNFLLGLSLIKFLGGTGIVTSFYLANKKMTFRRFLGYDIIANIGLAIFVYLIGWLAGKGFLLIETVENIKLAIATLIIFIILFHLVQKKINRKIENFIQQLEAKIN